MASAMHHTPTMAPCSTFRPPGHASYPRPRWTSRSHVYERYQNHSPTSHAAHSTFGACHLPLHLYAVNRRLTLRANRGRRCYLAPHTTDSPLPSPHACGSLFNPSFHPSHLPSATHVHSTLSPSPCLFTPRMTFRPRIANRPPSAALLFSTDPPHRLRNLEYLDFDPPSASISYHQFRSLLRTSGIKPHPPSPALSGGTSCARGSSAPLRRRC
ncbi:hypothetical protein BDN70DRAFT_479901 [Pholiota conissans]|uniref:Uncharacterized protein n=1 Tax=Pholiota conissans TaxID=109636 RepID=A0A9P5YR43_9AGAR|nr:hypothetical protein BDN70DRAFT_479901 [Pholiota conissans]